MFTTHNPPRDQYLRFEAAVSEPRQALHQLVIREMLKDGFRKYEATQRMIAARVPTPATA